MFASLLAFGWSWLGFGLPLGLNTVEGGEAALLVGASAARGGWRKAWLATVAALLTLIPFAVGLYFLFRYFPGSSIDYAIAAVIFVLGVNELREGLSERPRGRGRRRFPLDGPAGVDPADPMSIRRFQREHGLEPDAVIGAATRGALRSELAERGERPRPNRLGVDITDEESVRRFQRSRGLRPDGVVGPRTQGALAADATMQLLDPADASSITRFQRDHDLPQTGAVDAPTRAALHTIAVERRSDGDSGDGLPLDVTSEAAISRFQRERGLDATGMVDLRTQGALRAELKRRRGHAGASNEAAVAGVDPTDPRSIARFQELHGLEATGELDADTIEQLRRLEEWLGGVDPTDPGRVAEFQREHGLDPRGTVDRETQGALRAERARMLRMHGNGAVDVDDTWYPLDPTDSGSIAGFQREHDLEPNGEIDRATQAALRALRREREAGSGAGVQSRLGSYASVWPAYVGGVLESGEAVLYTFGVAHGSATWIPAAIGGAIGFALPWAGLAVLRGWVESKPEWLVELSIGVVLICAASTFGALRATGVFGG